MKDKYTEVSLTPTCSLPAQSSHIDQNWRMSQWHVHTFVYGSEATRLELPWKHLLGVRPELSLQQ